MAKQKIMVVEDEESLLKLESILLTSRGYQVCSMRNGKDALECIEKEKPDLVLLDVMLPEVDGFDVARHLPQPRPLVIFQTAFHEFALRAFEHEALDYVVKPVTLERLKHALERAQRRLEADRRVDFSSDLIARLTQTLGESARTARVLVNDGTGHRLLAYSEINRFVTDEGRVHAQTDRARYSCDYTLNELEERTAGSFVRTSRAELVNLERVQRIDAAGDGLALLTLIDGSRVHVSRRRVADVRRVLEGK